MGLHYTGAMETKVTAAEENTATRSRGTPSVVESNDHVMHEQEGGSYTEDLRRRWALIRRHRAAEDRVMEEAHLQFLAALWECTAAQRGHVDYSVDDGEVTSKRTELPF